MKRKAKPELIDQTELGRRAGLSRSRVRRLVADGLPTIAGKIDAAAAEKWIANNVDPLRATRTAPVRPGEDGAGLNELRRQREAVRIEQSRLELEIRKGELIERRVVKRFIAERARMERDSWISWASAAAARLSSTLHVDHGRLSASLADEVRAQLQNLSVGPLTNLSVKVFETYRPR